MENNKFIDKKKKLDSLLKNNIIDKKEYDEKIKNIKKEFDLKKEDKDYSKYTKKDILDLLLKEKTITKDEYVNEILDDEENVSLLTKEKFEEFKKKEILIKNTKNKELLNLKTNEDKEKIVAKPNVINENDLKNPFVKVDKLTKSYSKRKKPAIRNISFNIYPNQFHAFIGPNGAGKTTTIKSIIGGYSNLKFSGKIFINGIDNKNAISRKDIGYVPEEAKFPKRMKTIEYLMLMSLISGNSQSQSKKIIEEISIKLNMKNLINERPYKMSSGQKKKVLLAQALINNPKILIMDEPAANLDPLAREQLFSILVGFQNEGKSIFISSHILDEISKYATYVTVINEGQIKYDGVVNNHESLLSLYKENISKVF